MTQLDRLIGGVDRCAFTLKHVITSANTNDGSEGEWLKQSVSAFRQIYVIARIWGIFRHHRIANAVLKNFTRSTKQAAGHLGTAAVVCLASCAVRFSVFNK